MSDRILLAEVTGYDPATETEVVWKFATGQGYDAGGEDGFYAPRIENPALLDRAIGGDAGGRMSLSWGELTLVNIDGGLDAMADHYFDGRTFSLKVVRVNARYDMAVEILRAQIAAVAVEKTRVSVRLRDRTATLDKPFSSLKYAGDNELPNGIEGTADDLIDQPKPIVYGRVALMSPVLVNTAKLIYQVSARPVAAIVNVFDAGAYLDRVWEDYADQADMEANEPPPGAFRCWRAGGCFRLGATPFGTVSACVAESFSPARISAAGLLTRIVQDAAANRPDSEQPSGGWDWHWKDLQTLDEQNAGSLGLLVGPEETTASLLDRVCASVGAYWGFDALGKLRVVRLDAPSGTPALILTEDSLLALERLPDRQLPWQAVTLRADGNFAVQDKGGMAGVVPEARVNWFSRATRDQTWRDAVVAQTRKLSEESTYDTALNGIAVAAAEARRRVELYAGRRDLISLTVANPLSLIDRVDLGEVIELRTPRLGFASGKLFTVIGVRPDFGRNTMDITLLG